MALTLTGYSPRTEWVRSAWYKDPAVDLGCKRFDTDLQVPEATLASVKEQHKDCASCKATERYFQSGEYQHLQIKEGQTPTPIRFRVLTRKEVAAVEDIVRAATRPPPLDGETDEEHWSRWQEIYAFASKLRWFWACSLAVDFPDGIDGEPVEREVAHDMRVLAGWVLERLGEEFINTYGRWVWSRSQMTSDQKKASSSDATNGKPSPSTVTTPANAEAPDASTSNACSDVKTSTASGQAHP